MNATTVIAYTRDADIFHPLCLVEAMVGSGELSVAAVWDMAPEEAIRQYVEANALDEGDEDYPRPVFADESESHGYPCGICSEPILED